MKAIQEQNCFLFQGVADMEKYYVGLANSIVYTRYLDSFI